MAWEALGAACRIGSTPLSRVIAVCGVAAVPSVARMITASPFCRFMSVNVLDGMRLKIRCKSGGPPERIPPPPPPPDHVPPAGDGACAFPGLAGFTSPCGPRAAPTVPAAMPFRRMANICAISVGILCNCESGEIFTYTVFLLARSCTVSRPEPASTDFTVAAYCGNTPA